MVALITSLNWHLLITLKRKCRLRKWLTLRKRKLSKEDKNNQIAKPRNQEMNRPVMTDRNRELFTNYQPIKNQDNFFKSIMAYKV